MHKLYTNRNAGDQRVGGLGLASGQRRRAGVYGGHGRVEVNVAFNIGELHASAGRRIRGGGKGVIAGLEEAGGNGGGNGEIRCVRDTG